MRIYMAALPALALVMAVPAAAEHPDLSGFWNLEYKQDTSGTNVLLKNLPPNTVVLEDTGVAEYPQGEYGGLKPKPNALAIAQKWKPTDEMTLSRVCAAPSVIYTEQGPFPFEIYQTPELIVFRYEYFDQVRLIFMDGRGHLPEDAPHSKVGDSIGHWEGDELVVDTTHLVEATLTNNGLEHSDQVHLVERYKLSADGKSLDALQWFEDPKMLDNNGARLIQWKKDPNGHVYPYDCDPTISVEYQHTGESVDDTGESGNAGQ